MSDEVLQKLPRGKLWNTSSSGYTTHIRALEHKRTLQSLAEIAFKTFDMSWGVVNLDTTPVRFGLAQLNPGSIRGTTLLRTRSIPQPFFRDTGMIQFVAWLCMIDFNQFRECTWRKRVTSLRNTCSEKVFEMFLLNSVPLTSSAMFKKHVLCLTASEGSIINWNNRPSPCLTKFDCAPMYHPRESKLLLAFRQAKSRYTSAKEESNWQHYFILVQPMQCTCSFSTCSQFQILPVT